MPTFKNELFEKVSYSCIFDITRIQDIFGTDLTHYLELLYKFNNKYEETSTISRKYVNSDNLTLARTEIHRMNGAAGTLGLSEIHNAARQIESMLLTTPLMKEKILILFDLLDAAIESLVQFLLSQEQELDVKQHIELEPKITQQLCLEMQSYLSMSDTRCTQLFKENKEYFIALLPGEINRLQQCIEDFEYEEALEIIQNIRY